MHRLSPGGVLAILLGQILALGVLLVLWISWDPFRAALPHGLLLGFLPAIVPWAGALGGATNAVRSLVRYWSAHSFPWGLATNLKLPPPAGARIDPRVQKVVGERLQWNAWTVLQPLLGAVYGSFAVLLVALILGAVGTSKDGLDTTSRGKAVLAVVAFLVGYQQKVFHDLLDRSLSVLLGPGDVADEGDSSNASGALEVGPTPLNLTAPPGSTARQKVTLTNGTGVLVIKDEVHATVRSEKGVADVFTVNQLGRNIGRRSTGAVTVTFTPLATGTYHATLEVDHAGAVEQIELIGESADHPPAAEDAGSGQPLTGGESQPADDAGAAAAARVPVTTTPEVTATPVDPAVLSAPEPPDRAPAVGAEASAGQSTRSEDG
ncbi:MAG TPA: hypothetical protein VGC37_17125 [Friedmanniella sp.]